MSSWSKVDFCWAAVMSAFLELLFLFVCLEGTNSAATCWPTAIPHAESSTAAINQRAEKQRGTLLDELLGLKLNSESCFSLKWPYSNGRLVCVYVCAHGHVHVVIPDQHLGIIQDSSISMRWWATRHQWLVKNEPQRAPEKPRKKGGGGDVVPLLHTPPFGPPHHHPSPPGT